MCDLKYIGQLGSEPYYHIWTCHTHHHNFFSNSEDLGQCPKSTSTTITQPHHYPRCTCEVNSPYPGKEHAADCPHHKEAVTENPPNNAN